MISKRIVIKIGTNLLTDKDNNLNTVFLEGMIDQIANLRGKGFEPVIVSSGAVASGRSMVSLKKESKNIPAKQVLAAIGQGILMHNYWRLFQKHDMIVAQILLTDTDFTSRESFINTRNVLSHLFEMKVIPVVNENDVVANHEKKFGDNDMLSARLASMVDADLLILLTDVDGLFDSDPRTNPNAKRLKRVEKVTPEIKKMASSKASKGGTGGMMSKILAAEYATTSCIDAVVANGNETDVLLRVIEDRREMGTFFPALCGLNEKKKKWMKPQIVRDAWIEVDEGAKKALVFKGASLLPKGITKVNGEFRRGDVVHVVDGKHQKIAFGLVNYGAKDIEKIQGRHSDEISEILKTCFESEVMHRDNLVLGG